MAFDGMMMRALCREFNGLLQGARVEKITQPERDEVILFLHAFDPQEKKHKSCRLLLCVNPSYPRIHLTEQNRENPAVAPNFCMLLRKHLLGARLTKIVQPGAERVLRFVFEGKSELYETTQRELVVEIMGRASNMILMTADGKILDALHQTDISDATKRCLLPGIVYEMPPAQDKKTLEEVLAFPEEWLQTEERLDKLLCATIQGFSPTLAREVAYRVSGVTDAPCHTLTADQKVAVFQVLQEVEDVLENGGTVPTVVVDRKPVEFCFLSLKQYGEMGTQQTYPTCSEAVEAFYLRKAMGENMRRSSADMTKLLQTQIARLSRKIEVQRGEMETYEKADIYKLFGDLITASIGQIKRGDKRATVVNYWSENLENVTVDLDERLSPSQNAQRYYRLYKKAQTAKDILRQRIPEAMEEMAYLTTLLDAVTRCENYADLGQIRQEMEEEGYLKKRPSKRKPMPSQSKPLSFMSDDGFRILVGKNNLQNDYLTTKLAQKRDMWFHVKNYAGSHTVLLCDGQTPPNRTLEQAAVLAATYSAASSGEKVEVDYTEIRNVKKPSGAKPGRVIYVSFQTAVVTADPALAKELSEKCEKDVAFLRKV